MEDILRLYREATGSVYDGDRYNLDLQENYDDESDVDVPLIDFDFDEETENRSSDNESDTSDSEGEERLDRRGGRSAVPNAPADDEWSDQTSEVLVEPFIEETGPNHDLGEEKGPYDFFSLFIPEETYFEIAHQTNLYARQRQEQKGTADKYWHDVTPEEIKLYFNIMILMGIHNLPEYWMFWSSDDRIGVKGVSSLMGKSRYEKISQYFHLNDSSRPEATRGHENYDPLHKTRPLIDMVKTNIAKVFNAGRDISIDEAMISFNGRLSFLQYVKGKPNPWGIKVWCTADAATGYLLDFDIYTGRVSDPMPHGSGHYVITKLGQNFLGKHHHFFYDNFFSSVQLSKDLLSASTYSCSTIRPNRKGWPTALKPQNTKNMKRGDVRVRQQGNIVATVWKDKRLVSTLTTNTTPGMTTVSRRSPHGSVDVEIPSPIAAYNKCMGGVDRFDQLCSYYPVGRRSVKWWKYIFCFLLQTTLVNSWIVYCASRPRPNGRRMSQIDFRLAISDMLVKGNICRKKGTTAQHPATLGVGTANLLDHRLIRLTGNKRACFWCVRNKNFTKRARARETVYGCNICQIRLCKGDCYTSYHESLNQ